MPPEKCPNYWLNWGSEIVDQIKERLIGRLVLYAKIDSAANEETKAYPSSPGQLALGALLVEELHSMGLSGARQDENGLVWCSIGATAGNEEVPGLLFNAHLDTSPEAPGENCRPRIIEHYDGGDIALENGDFITLQETPELASLVGHTLVTTDGRTLLGGDDKAGVAAIMEIVARLVESKKTNDPISHGPVDILFTCDEEIGRGTKHFHRHQTQAVGGFTLDGGGAGAIDVETFSADLATVRFAGRNTHPSVGKGKMVNALRAAAQFLTQLPMELSPERTEGRDGFLHPYDLEGGVSEATVRILLRAFDEAELDRYAGILEQISRSTEDSVPGLKVAIDRKAQYRNMGDGLKQSPQIVELAVKAFEKLAVPYRKDIIRGGTDGALMTAKGLPMPNLSVGQYNIHSTREFASITQVEQAIEHAITMLQLWASPENRQS